MSTRTEQNTYTYHDLQQFAMVWGDIYTYLNGWGQDVYIMLTYRNITRSSSETTVKYGFKNYMCKDFYEIWHGRYATCD
jgi:hypothetical protein